MRDARSSLLATSGVSCALTAAWERNRDGARLLFDRLTMELVEIFDSLRSHAFALVLLLVAMRFAIALAARPPDPDEEILMGDSF